jgi:hypothetical protein
MYIINLRLATVMYPQFAFAEGTGVACPFIVPIPAVVPAPRAGLTLGFKESDGLGVGDG